LEAEPLVFETLERQNYSKVSAGYADILLPFDTVRILNVHLGSTGVRDGDMSVEPSREELLEAGQFVARKIAQSDKTRGLQGEEILDWIDKSPHPVILTGDFNGVPGGNLYARLLWKLHDPYVFHGYGTWGSFEPLSRRGLLFRIDWTLHDQTLSSTGQRIDNIPFSDHRPLITTFVPTLPEPEEE
jgi:endonuclease/exonuclease/phosphatase family metal-dependent hydrolase